MFSSVADGTTILITLPIPQSGSGYLRQLQEHTVHEEKKTSIHDHMQNLQQALVNQDIFQAIDSIAQIIHVGSAMGANRVVAQATRLIGRIEMEEWEESAEGYQKLSHIVNQTDRPAQ